MPDEVGGQPFPDGQEPDDRRHGDADEEFASVVFDEDFVRSAPVHEPTATERLLTAAQSHTESDASRPFDDGYAGGPGGEGESGFDDDLSPYAEYRHGPGTPSGYGYGFDPAYAAEHSDLYDPEEDGPRQYRSHLRWQRPVAWVLAVVMGVGMVALAFTAVHRSVAGQRQEPAPPPTTTGVDGRPDDERVAPGVP